MLYAAFDVYLFSARVETAAKLLFDRRKEPFARLAAPGHLLDYGVVAVGVEVFDGKVFELVLHLLHPEPVGERRVDLHRLESGEPLLFGRAEAQGPYVMKTVGELYEYDADILGHRQEHFAKRLYLLLLFGGVGDLTELCDAVDKLRHLAAEHLFDLRQGDDGVLDGVVKEGGDYRLGIGAIFGQDYGDVHGVRDIIVAAVPFLAAVGFLGDLVGVLDLIEVVSYAV